MKQHRNEVSPGRLLRLTCTIGLLLTPLATLALSLAEDADADNMLDTWELANGLNPGTPADADADNDGDGVPNRGEYHLGSDPNDAQSLPAFNDNYTESFESGTLPAPWFVPTGADAGWSPENTSAQDGAWSLRSDSVTVWDDADVVLPVYVHHSEISLWQFWNSASYDDFHVYIDGLLVYSSTDAPRGWIPTPSFTLTEGYHEILFRFDKGSTTLRACRCTLIDSLAIELRDADLDSLPDDWELANGLDPSDPSDAAGDLDGDGLDNLSEYEIGTDVSLPDTDGDGLTDGDEVDIYNTFPRFADSDLDGLPDGWEIGANLDPRDASDAGADADGDQVSNEGEYRLGTDPNDATSTPPFVDDYTESFEAGVVPPGWTVSPDADGGFAPGNLTASDGTWSLRSDPVASNDRAVIEFASVAHLSDLSFDYFVNSSNGYPEFEVYLDGELLFRPEDPPRGWYDSPALEIPPGYHTIRFEFDRYGTGGCRCVHIDNVRFTLVDADNDGMRDSWELERGLDPADPSDAALDGDGDGLDNRAEYENDTNPNRADGDYDGLDDGTEINVYATDPNSRDTDLDGIDDGGEVATGLNPLDGGDAELDDDSDGYSNFVEYRLESDLSDAGSTPPLATSITEDFESGLPRAWYTPDSDRAQWYLTRDDASEGSGSLRSFPHPEGNTGFGGDVKQVAVVINVEQGQLSLDYRNVEQQYALGDWLRVYVDDSLWINSTNNDPDWESSARNLSEGVHIIRIEHISDSPTNSANFGYIDNLRFVADDADGDGLRDAWELDYGLDPNDPSDATGDLDGDGLTNQEEAWLSSRPDSADSDGDGIADIDEVREYGTYPWRADSDGDVMSDAYELANGLNPTERASRTVDTDGDGVGDRAEARLGTAAGNAASTPPYMDGYVESFEDGAIPADWFSGSGVFPSYASDADWYASSATASDGSWSIRSGAMPRNDRSNVVLPIVVHETNVQFDYFVNSAVNDPFTVHIDNEEVFRVSNTTAPRGWQTSPVFRLTEGYHEIRFEFQRVSFDTRACRCVWLDNIRFTSLDADADRLPDDWETQYGLNPDDAADAALDSDGDGLDNLGEWQAGTAADDPDSDADALPDGAEIAVHGTDPLDSDTDGDGAPDGWEVTNGLRPAFAPDGADDPDGDGVFSAGEYTLGRDPNVAEALPAYMDNYAESFETGVLPGDWFVPADAEGGWTVQSATASDGGWSLRSAPTAFGDEAAVTLPLTSHLSDLQFDFFWNSSSGDEFRVYINGVLEYSITDAPRGWYPSPVFELAPGYNEITFGYFDNGPGAAGCRCTFVDNLRVTRVDADADGMRDSWELANGLDPSDPADGALDADGDGLDNAGEYLAGSDLAASDTDGDGLTDGDEVNMHLSDPTLADTDGDSLPDAYELANGLDLRQPAGEQDNDGDGYIDVHEYRLGSSPSDDTSVPPFLGDFVESFESGVLSNAWFQPEPGRGTEWTIVNDKASDGIRSLRSNAVQASGDTEYRRVSWLVNVRGSVFVADHNVVNDGSDTIVIRVDDTVLEFRSAGGSDGSDVWLDTRYSEFDRYVMRRGVHELTFEFRGYNSDSDGYAWVDNLRFDELGSP